MHSEPTLHRLESLSPRAFQHPADRAATAALGQVPGLDTAIRRLSEFRYERALRQLLLANAVEVGPRQLPEMWEAGRGTQEARAKVGDWLQRRDPDED